MTSRNQHHTSPRRREVGGKAATSAALCLDEYQREFAAAILDPDRPVPCGLVGPDGKPSARRFTVYRNNVVAGLVETLKAAFPATRRIVGDDFFSAMARIYVAREPPQSPIMLDYGAGFADFVDAFEPAAGLVYLRDVARVERAWLEAYHAADARILDPAQLRDIAVDRLPHMSFVLHPSVRVVRSSFPAVSIWQMNVGDGVPSPIDIERGGEDALVFRPAAEVEVRTLPAGAAVFTQALTDGLPVIDATTATLRAHPAFDLPRALEGLLAAGVIAGWKSPEDRCVPTPARFA